MGKIEQNLQEILNLIVDAYKTLKERLKDGFQYMDLAALIPVLMQVEPAIKDADHALHYLKDMTAEKRQDIINSVLEKIGDTGDNARQGVTLIIESAATNYMLIRWGIAQAKTSSQDQAEGDAATAGR